MTTSPLRKALWLLIATVGVVTTSFAFTIMHHDSGDRRIALALTDQRGLPVTEKTLAGRHLLVFFGFTSCHDICPSAMVKLTQVLNALEQTAHQWRLRTVFISVDPERDTPARLAEFLGHFHGDVIGLTGSRAALRSATSTFRTYFDERQPLNEEASMPSGHSSVDSTHHGHLPPDYQVTHSSVLYIVDPFGRLVTTISVDAAVEDIVSKLHEVL